MSSKAAFIVALFLSRYPPDEQDFEAEIAALDEH
jgi:hypothetical protein